MSNARTNTVRGIPSVIRRPADPYWRKNVALTGLDPTEPGESAAATGEIVTVDFRTRTKTMSAQVAHAASARHIGKDKRIGAILVAAPPENQFAVASGHVLTTMAGTTAWVPYEASIYRGIAEIEYPNAIFLPPETHAHGTSSYWDQLYTRIAETPTGFAGYEGDTGWVTCFSEEAPTQENAYCLAFSVPLPRSFAGSDAEAAIRGMRSLPGVGTAIADRLQELLTLRRDEPDAAPMSAPSVAGMYLALYKSTNLELPRISLTADGNIYATWKDQRGNVFSVHFLSQAEARYALVRSDPQNSERTLRSSGSVPPDAIFRLPETAAASWAVR